MAWFSPFARGELVTLDAAEIAPEPQPSSLLVRSRTSVENMIDRFREDEMRLVGEIADASERLRQTRVAIEAFEAANRILSADEVKADLPPARGVSAALAEAVHVTSRGKVVKSRLAS